MIVWIFVTEVYQTDEKVATPPVVTEAPTAAALPRLVKQLDKLADSVLIAEMVFPAVIVAVAVTAVPV